MTLELEYRSRFSTVLQPASMRLEIQLKDLLKDVPRIDRVIARPKGIDSFLNKAAIAIDGRLKYEFPLSEIQDQIGARIITFFLSDVPKIDDLVLRYYEPIEIKSHVPENEWEFGYFGRHFVLPLPTDCLPEGVDRNLVPAFFELQIKTLFQHAWSEADHDLGYKAGANSLTADQRRRLAFTSAQAWGADQIFDELFRLHSQ